MNLASRISGWFKPRIDEDAILRKRAQATQAETNGRAAKSVQESFCWGGGNWLPGYLDFLSSNYPDRLNWATTSTTNDRRAGRDFPFFINEWELGILRQPARVLCGSNSYCIGMQRAMSSYAIDNGFTYVWQTKGVKGKAAKDDANSPLVRETQTIWDEFAEREIWPELETELFERDHRDGEDYLLHGRDEDDRTWVRTMEPEQIYLPAGVTREMLAEVDARYIDEILANVPDATTFGILSPPSDPQKTLGYFSHNLLNPALCEFYLHADVVHTKINTDRSIKRGLTDYCYDTFEALNDASKLRKNLVIGAAVRAAIAFIRQHREASVQQINDFQTAQSTARPTGCGNFQNYGSLPPGSVVDIDGQQEVAPLPGETGSAAALEILQACIRGAAVRNAIPEWISSGLHDTSSFASSLTAESPWVKATMTRQFFTMRRRMRTCRIVLRHAVETRRLPPEALDRLECKITPPRVEVRDTEQQARVDQMYVAMGEKSLQTVSQEQGRDYDEEQKFIAEHRAKNPQVPTGGGLPGMGGTEEGRGRTPEVERAVPESKDDAGHEHKGSGPGGGQFTSSGGGGSSENKPALKINGQVRKTPSGKTYIEIVPHSSTHDKIDAAEEIELGGKTYTISGYGDTYSTSQGKMMRAYLVEAPIAGARSITKTSSMRNVDAYHVGGMLNQDGKYVVITSYKRTEDDNGSFIHSMDVRPATADEEKKGRIADIEKLQRAMGAGPDDDRDRDKHNAEYRRLENEKRSLQGKPSVEEEIAKAAEPKKPNLSVRKSATAATSKPREQRTDADWDSIANALVDISGGKRHFSGGEIKKWSDSEIKDWFEGEVMESRETPVADAYADGVATLQRITETAVKRMLALGDAAANQGVLFTAEELAAISAAIGQGTAIARAVGEEEARKQIERQAVEAELEAVT